MSAVYGADQGCVCLLFMGLTRDVCVCCLRGWCQLVNGERGQRERERERGRERERERESTSFPA